MEHYDVIVIGGGPGGLVSAIHLGLEGFRVCVVERHAYPHHKVCGEYLSNEVAPYLERLGIPIKNRSVPMRVLGVGGLSGRRDQVELPLGGMGISRYTLDAMLYERAKELGVRFVFGKATGVDFHKDVFQVVVEERETFTSIFVIGAYGKRSVLDKRLRPGVFEARSQWMGVKAHFRHGTYPDHEVGLFPFKGGYAGLSRTETGDVNFCALVRHSRFSESDGLAGFYASVSEKNPFLGTFFETAEPCFERPMAIAQLSFAKKDAVSGHILYCGDTAGTIHPLCGNGMAMAIHGAKMVAEAIGRYFADKGYGRERLEEAYQKSWQQTFGRRLWMGRNLQYLMLHDHLMETTLTAMGRMPGLLRGMVRQTHGELMV